MNILEEIKNSIRNALFALGHDINFHFEEISHTGFPCAVLSVKEFRIEPNLSELKQKYDIDFELVYMKSSENTMSELFETVDFLKNALLPVISLKGKKITVDSPLFVIREKKLVMTFALCFYVFEQETEENMQTLDITIKEGKNAN